MKLNFVESDDLDSINLVESGSRLVLTLDLDFNNDFDCDDENSDEDTSELLYQNSSFLEKEDSFLKPASNALLVI